MRLRHLTSKPGNEIKTLDELPGNEIKTLYELPGNEIKKLDELPGNEIKTLDEHDDEEKSMFLCQHSKNGALVHEYVQFIEKPHTRFLRHYVLVSW